MRPPDNNTNPEGEHPDGVQTVPAVPDTETIVAYVAMSLGEPVQLVWAVRNFDVRRSTRDRRLQTFSEVLEQVARTKPAVRKSVANPLSRYWGIWHAIRQVSFSRPHLERRVPLPGKLSHAAMAARLFTYWGGHPCEYQVHSAVQPKVSRSRGTETRSWLEQAAANWASYYEVSWPRGTTQGPRLAGSSVCFVNRWDDLSCRYCDANKLHAGLRPDKGHTKCKWDPETGELWCRRSSGISESEDRGRSVAEPAVQQEFAFGVVGESEVE